MLVWRGGSSLLALIRPRRSPCGPCTRAWGVCALRSHSIVPTTSVEREGSSVFLHERGVEAEEALVGLPSLHELRQLFAKPCRLGSSVQQEINLLIKAIYSLALHRRAGHYIPLGSPSNARILRRVHKEICERTLETALQTRDLLVVGYSLVSLHQHRTFLLLLPRIRAGISSNLAELGANELLKLSWMLHCIPLDPLLPEIARASLQREIGVTYLAGIAKSLSIAIAQAANSETLQLENELQAVLDRIASGFALDSLSLDDILDLANGLVRVPQSMGAKQFAPHLVSVAMLKDLPPKVVSALQAYIEQHRSVVPAEPLTALIASFTAVIDDVRRMLLSVATSSPERSTHAEECCAPLQELEIAILGELATKELLSSFGVAPLSTDVLHDSVAGVKAARGKPMLDAHPAPMRVVTFARVQWNLRGNRGSGQSVSGDRILRSGNSSVRVGGRRRHKSGPLLSLNIGGFDRDADAEIRCLRLVLEDALGLVKPVVGNVDLFVDMVPCISCVGAMAQFLALLPDVQLRCSFDVVESRNRAFANVYSVAPSVESGHSSEHSFAGGLEVLNRMLREEQFLPSSQTFHGLIAMGLREGRFDESWDVLKLMHEHCIQPDARTYGAFVKRATARQAVSLLEDMEIHGLRAEPPLVDAVLIKCTQEEPGELAPSFLETWCLRTGSAAPTVRACEAVAGSARLCSVACWGRALTAWALTPWARQLPPGAQVAPFLALVVACTTSALACDMDGELDLLGSAQPVFAALRELGLAKHAHEQVLSHGIRRPARLPHSQPRRVTASGGGCVNSDQAGSGGDAGDAHQA